MIGDSFVLDAVVHGCHLAPKNQSGGALCQQTGRYDLPWISCWFPTPGTSTNVCRPFPVKHHRRAANGREAYLFINREEESK